MTDTVVKLDADTGTATIEIRCVKTTETRFRLRDPASEKYLTRRGWTKAASFLPVEAVISDDVATISLDAELVRKIPLGAYLTLEQPAANIFANLAWPAATETDVTAPDDAPPMEPGALLMGMETLEPSIRDEAIVDAPPAQKVDDIDSAWDTEEQPRPWSLLALVAAVFMIIGLLIGYLWQGSSYDQDLRTAMKAVEAQRDQQRVDFEARLKVAEANASKTTDGAIEAARQEATTLSAEVERLGGALKAAEAQVAAESAKAGDLAAQLEQAQAAAKTATDKSGEDSQRLTDRVASLEGELATTKAELVTRNEALATVQDQLTRTKSQVDALEQAAASRDEAEAQAANAQLEDANKALETVRKDLAAREQSLRDIEAKLAVADVQIEALKEVAGKAAKAELDGTAGAAKLAQLTTELEAANKALAEKEKALVEAQTSLDTANALLKSNGTDSAETEPARTTDDGESATIIAGLEKERDLYRGELEAMTKSFTDLQAEKQALLDKIKQGENATETTPASIPVQPLAQSRAIWGATAIDASGSIYSLQNQIAEQSATDNVLALCRGKSNGRCQALRSYSNSCFSLARITGEDPRNDNFGFATNKDWKRAEAEAKRQCEELGDSCTIRFTACSPDSISKPVAKSE